MKTYSFKTGWLKLVLGWILVFAIRLIPFRPPNFEPVLATVMPFSKKYGLLESFSFGFLSIVLFDAVTSGIGLWTVGTSITYGILGVGSYFFFKNHSASVKNFLIYGIIGTLFYDLITGILMGPLLFHQPFMVALIGQIPFTLSHLLGTITFSVFLSPVLYRWVVKNDALEFSFPFQTALAHSRVSQLD